MLKKGDIWPGSVVQLFGTHKGVLQTTVTDGYLAWLSREWLHRAKLVVCCSVSILFDFFKSLFGNVGEQRSERGYARVSTRDVASVSSFREPGRVPSPGQTVLP